MPKLIIVQPWFSAVGHPAQSLINTARVIGANSYTAYLISSKSDCQASEIAKVELQKLGRVIEYPVKTNSVREGTLKALLSIKKLLSSDFSIDRFFFLDAHLVLLAALWPFFYKKTIRQLGVVYLMGPERVTRYSFVKALVRWFLQRDEVTLFLRTAELAKDWKKTFPEACIKCLPSLELPTDIGLSTPPQIPSEALRLGILGQIRTGKSIEWMVPLLKSNPSLGKLTIAGTFNNKTQRQALNILEGFEGFQDKFLSEEELLSCAIEQDYLLMLYDNWDHRMEGAVMFLAARVNRPVVVYDKGWCGRMVKQYGNGVLAPEDHASIPQFLKTLPSVGSVAYNALLLGVVKFRKAHSGEANRKAFLDAI